MGLNLTKCWIFIFFGFLVDVLGNDLVEVNRIVARVNDQVITWGEIEIAMEKLNFSAKEKSLRAQEFVDGKIDRLLSQLALRNKGMEIPESYIEQEYSQKLMSNFNGDRKLFREVLQSNGQSPMEYKNQLKEDIIHMHMLGQRKRNGDEISPQSVEEYYQQNLESFRTERRIRLREIVFSENNSDLNKTSEESARIVYASILEGGDFNALASSNGQSPFYSNGGDWGVFVTPSEIRNVKIRKVAFSLGKNDVSPPFKVKLLEKKKDGSIGESSNFTWYILKVDEVEPAKLLPIDEVSQEIEKILAKEIEIREQRIWLSRQKRDAYVDINLPE